jgi:hypothetical protein
MEMLKFHDNVDDDGRKVPVGNELSLILCARELLRTTVGTAKEDLIATSKIKLVRTRWGSLPKREAKL